MKYKRLRKIEKRLDKLITEFDDECGDTPELSVQETYTHLVTANMWMLRHIILMEKLAGDAE